MAITTTDKYLNLIFSLMISNRTKTNDYFVLPDDFRKLENIKIKDSRISSFTIAAGGRHTFDIFDLQQNFFFVIGSHPFVVSRLNYAALGTSSRLFTSFFATGRDRPGSINLNISPFFEIENTLDSTDDYIRVSGSGTTDLELIVVELSIE